MKKVDDMMARLCDECGKVMDQEEHSNGFYQILLIKNASGKRENVKDLCKNCFDKKFSKG